MMSHDECEQAIPGDINTGIYPVRTVERCSVSCLQACLQIAAKWQDSEEILTGTIFTPARTIHIDLHELVAPSYLYS